MNFLKNLFLTISLVAGLPAAAWSMDVVANNYSNNSSAYDDDQDEIYYDCNAEEPKEFRPSSPSPVSHQNAGATMPILRQSSPPMTGNSPTQSPIDTKGTALSEPPQAPPSPAKVMPQNMAQTPLILTKKDTERGAKTQKIPPTPWITYENIGKLIVPLGSFALSYTCFGNSPTTSLYMAAMTYSITQTVLIPYAKPRDFCIELAVSSIAACAGAFVVSKAFPFLTNYLTKQ